MKIIDSNNLSNIDASKEFFDFCIVGAGVAGLIMADQLCDRFNIAIIESGDFNVNDKAQELNETILSGHPVRNHLQNRIRQLGGSCNVWAGRSLVLNNIDFRFRPWVNNSGWPFSKQELQQYYSMLYGKYKMADFELFQNEIDDISDALYKDLFRGDDLESIKAVWAKKITRFGKKSETFRRLVRSNNVTLYKNATVSKLSDSNRSVVKCEITSLSNKSFSVPSKIFVIAAGGIENARILLSSKDQNVNGIGNTYDNVGRYFMDHPSAVRRGIKLLKPIHHSSLFVKPLRQGRFKNVIRFSENYQEKNLLTNNHIEFSIKYPKSYEDAFSNIVQIGKTILKKGSSKKRYDFSQVSLGKIPEIIYLLSPSELVPHFISRTYHYFNKMTNRPLNCDEIVLSHHLEQVPNKNSRITLSKQKNKLNINKVNLNWKIGDQEIETAQMLENEIISKLQKSGWIDKNVKNEELNTFNDASHHIGTTRMNDDPLLGVVDRNCKVHLMDNLFIAGSSVFPTSGSANPTYTIAAMSLRLAYHLRGIYDKTK